MNDWPLFSKILFLIHSASTLYLTGMIWVVQLVHYPTFHWIDAERFTQFEKFHTRAMCWVVVPVMVAELVTGAILAWSLPIDSPFYWQPFFYANLTLVLLVWLSTFFLSVPLHGALSVKRDSQKISRLIQTNWLRTLLWTLKSLLLFFVLIRFVL